MYAESRREGNPHIRAMIDAQEQCRFIDGFMMARERVVELHRLLSNHVEECNATLSTVSPLEANPMRGNIMKSNMFCNVINPLYGLCLCTYSTCNR